MQTLYFHRYGSSEHPVLRLLRILRGGARISLKVERVYFNEESGERKLLTNFDVSSK